MTASLSRRAWKSLRVEGTTRSVLGSLLKKAFRQPPTARPVSTRVTNRKGDNTLRIFMREGFKVPVLNRQQVSGEWGCPGWRPGRSPAGWLATTRQCCCHINRAAWPVPAISGSPFWAARSTGRDPASGQNPLFQPTLLHSDKRRPWRSWPDRPLRVHTCVSRHQDFANAGYSQDDQGKNQRTDKHIG